MCFHALLWLSVAAAILTLQGCDSRKGCKIDDVYQLIQVDGRTGLGKAQLEKAGVKLCARHLKKEETYENDACMEPGEVFANGELPTTANGDVNALLLVRCPSTAYPKGKELQRVTCSDDFMGEDEDGDIEKALHIRFDNYERASNCLLADNISVDDLMNEDNTETDNHGNTAKEVELFKAIDRATEDAHDPAVASSLGPPLLGRKASHPLSSQALSEAGTVLRDTDVNIYPHGVVAIRHSEEPHVQHGQHRKRENEQDASHQDAKLGIMRSAIAATIK
jgi:hypothetical protein